MLNVIFNLIMLLFFVGAVLIAYHLMDIEDEGGWKNKLAYVLISVFSICITANFVSEMVLGPERVYIPIESEQEETETDNNDNSEPMNTDLPKDMYYLGVEVVNVEPLEDGVYQYEFGVVDMDWIDILYLYRTDYQLDMDVPYMLIMDSMETEDKLDDQIVVVWACVE